MSSIIIFKFYNVHQVIPSNAPQIVLFYRRKSRRLAASSLVPAYDLEELEDEDEEVEEVEEVRVDIEVNSNV